MSPRTIHIDPFQDSDPPYCSVLGRNIDGVWTADENARGAHCPTADYTLSGERKTTPNKGK